MPAQADRSPLNVVEAHEQLHDRGLPRARRPHDGDGLTGLDPSREVGNDGAGGVIAEAHVIEGHVARDIARRGARHGVCGLVGLKELENALGCGRHLLQHVRDLRKLGDRLREVPDVLDERLDVADRDDAANLEIRAEHRDDHVPEIRDEVHDRHHEPRDELGFPCRGIEHVVGAIEFLDLLALTVEGAHDLMARERLLDPSVDIAEAVLLGLEVLLRTFHELRDEQPRYGNDKHRHERHGNVDGQHHRKHAHDRDRRRDKLRQTLVEALSKRVDVVGDARKDVARGALLDG